MVEHIEYFCRQNIIDQSGNWTVEKLCEDCQSSLFIKLMLSAELGKIRNAKSIMERTISRIE